MLIRSCTSHRTLVRAAGVSHGTLTRAADPPAKQVDFTRDVKPIFARHCYLVPRPGQAEERMALDRNRGRASRVVTRERCIAHGKAAESKLVAAHRSRRHGRAWMPPKKPALTASRDRDSGARGSTRVQGSPMTPSQQSRPTGGV